MAATTLPELSILIDKAFRVASVLKHSVLTQLLAMASLEASLLIEQEEKLAATQKTQKTPLYNEDRRNAVAADQPADFSLLPAVPAETVLRLSPTRN